MLLNTIAPQGGVESHDRPTPRWGRRGSVAKELLTEIITREGRLVAHCLRVIIWGLRSCNAALDALQPKQPGRITLLETNVEGRSKLSLNGTRWWVVRWRIRRSYSDGSVE